MLTSFHEYITYQTVALVSTFFAVMTLFPAVQKRAHSELDAVLGVGRMPTFTDRKLLPYIDCILAEILRWRPPVPFGETLDSYNAYFICAFSQSDSLALLTHR